MGGVKDPNAKWRVILPELRDSKRCQECGTLLYPEYDDWGLFLARFCKNCKREHDRVINRKCQAKIRRENYDIVRDTMKHADYYRPVEIQRWNPERIERDFHKIRPCGLIGNLNRKDLPIHRI